MSAIAIGNRVYYAAEDDVLRGDHVHLCPRCFEHVPCEDWCSWAGESAMTDGTPICHAALCDLCRMIIENHESDGSGI